MSFVTTGEREGGRRRRRNKGAVTCAANAPNVRRWPYSARLAANDFRCQVEGSAHDDGLRGEGRGRDGGGTGMDGGLDEVAKQRQ